MAKRNTKEIILFEALKLFADKGYDGVTVRDIANEVGIMQSSLYKHYASKQEIFDTLIEKMQERFADASLTFQLPEGEINEVANKYASGETSVLKKISTSIFLFYLKDEYTSQFRRMLTIEKYKNGEIEKIYREIFIDAALLYQSSLFSEMINQGFMKQADPNLMALHFYSPIFLLLNKYDGIPEREKEALDLLEKHIDQFELMYRKEDIR